MRTSIATTRARALEPLGQVATLPRILLVEDDPVSRSFLAAALEALPAHVDAVASCAQARQAAAETTDHALWLIDAHLPDGGGVELLADLRTRAPATPALAHTADPQADAIEALLAAGFVDVLIKPISASALLASVRHVLGSGAPAEVSAIDNDGQVPDWDDQAALTALNGEPAHVASLRRLFLEELPQQRESIVAALAAGDATQAGEILHRLRASCGFVGAARLGEAVRRLQDEPGSVDGLCCFQKAVVDLIEAG